MDSFTSTTFPPAVAASTYTRKTTTETVAYLLASWANAETTVTYAISKFDNFNDAKSVAAELAASARNSSKQAASTSVAATPRTSSDSLAPSSISLPASSSILDDSFVTSLAPNSSTQSVSSTNELSTGIIGGVAAGAAIALLLLMSVLFLCVRSRRARREKMGASIALEPAHAQQNATELDNAQIMQFRPIEIGGRPDPRELHAPSPPPMELPAATPPSVMAIGREDKRTP